MPNPARRYQRRPKPRARVARKPAARQPYVQQLARARHPTTRSIIPRSLGATLGTMAGTALGGPFGGIAGGALGQGLQSLVKHITGFGDYTIRANSIMGGTYDPPELHNNTSRTVCIRHREYIGDITASSAFTLQSYSINPGLFSTFPWLSQVGEAFEEYRFTGLVFEYKTLSADYTTASSAALGFVAMATQYNVLSPNFPDKKTMENYEFSNSGKPSETFIHPVECKRSLNPVSELFVRVDNPPTGDLRLYDHGNFQIATGGNSGSGVLGELWCTFEIEFYKPKLISAEGDVLLTDHYYSPGPTDAAPFGLARNYRAGSNLGTTITNSGTKINWPVSISAGTYLIVFNVIGSVVGVGRPGLTYVNCVPLNLFSDDSVSVIDNNGTSSAAYLMQTVLQVTGSGATLALAGGTYPTSGTQMDLIITLINPNIIT